MTTTFGQAGALSRLIDFQTKTSEDIVAVNKETEKEVRRILDDVIDGLSVTFTATIETTENGKRS